MSYIGRKKEILLFNKLANSTEAEMVALYGRRRVGKTQLVRHCFKDKACYLEFTGIQHAPLLRQLLSFSETVAEKFYPGAPIKTPENWHNAFKQLTQLIKPITDRPVVLFFDELPWMSTARSGLLQELDYYWNTQWSKQKNVLLIVCGSAASWMLKHIINAKGGLHNRVSQQILLKPFDLSTTKLFLKKVIGYKLSHKQITSLYMVTGGIPYYLKQINPQLSIIQNIQALCFTETGLLYDEFQRLFHSLFKEAEKNLQLIRLIAKTNQGISRNDILKASNIKSGGTFDRRLEELQAAGFIQKYIPFGKKSRSSFYRIIDEYSLFYLRWIEPIKQQGYTLPNDHWQKQSMTPAAHAWSGLAFENICLKHTEQLRKALQLTDVACQASSWRVIPKKRSLKQGAQIDLLFNRSDDAITIFEMKFTEGLFILDKAYAKQLANKLNIFEEATGTTKQCFLVLVTANGMKESIWSEGLISQHITLDALFNDS